MKRVRYVGPERVVSLAPAAGGVTFVRGEPVEVDDGLAVRLVEQGTFEYAVPPGRGSAARARPGVETR